MNKAQAMYLLLLAQEAQGDPEIMDRFHARFGTYGVDVMREGYRSLMQQHKLEALVD